MAEKVKIKEWKKEKVEELTKLIKKYKVIGLLKLDELPSSQFQTIRGKLRGDVLIITSKKSFLSRAFEKTNNKDLVEKMEGSPAVILTNLSPFKIYKIIQKNKSVSSIKPGQIAPIDLIVKKGETPFAPGPIIGELGEIGVRAKIMNGKINVLKDAVVVKQGEPAGEKAASILTRLGVKPMEIGLDLVVIKEDDILYTSEDLDVDVENLIITAYIRAKNLVLNTGMIIPEFIEEVLMKAQMSALILNGVVHPEQAVKTQAAPSKDIKEEKEEEVEDEEEEVSDEEAAAGLGALFG